MICASLGAMLSLGLLRVLWLLAGHGNFPNPKLDFIMKEKGDFVAKIDEIVGPSFSIWPAWPCSLVDFI